MSAALDAPLARALGRGRHAAPPRHRAPVLGDDFHRPLPRGRRSAERFEPMPLDVLERLVARTTTAAAASVTAVQRAHAHGQEYVSRHAPNHSWTLTPTWSQVITGPLDPEDNLTRWAPLPDRQERSS